MVSLNGDLVLQTHRLADVRFRVGSDEQTVRGMATRFGSIEAAVSEARAVAESAEEQAISATTHATVAGEAAGRANVGVVALNSSLLGLQTQLANEVSRAKEVEAGLRKDLTEDLGAAIADLQQLVDTGHGAQSVSLAAVETQIAQLNEGKANKADLPSQYAPICPLGQVTSTKNE